MGNCQAAEAAVVAIHHPTGTKVEMIHWSVSAHEIMSANPGHYVAHVITASPQAASAKCESGTPSRKLRLLRPDDTLHIGQAYRLVSFEDVLKEFAAKKCVKLGRLMERSGGIGVGVESKEKESTTSRGPSSKRDSASADTCMSTKEEQEVDEMGSSGGDSGGGGGNSLRGAMGGGRQWKPALQSISEIGS